jgi:SAM-dependent methyltransferase
MGYGKGIAAIIPTLTWQASPKIDVLVRSLPTDARIIDLGAGGRKLAPNVITMDIDPRVAADYHGDITHTAFPDESFDLVLATGVLEHVEDDHALLCEMIRLTKPGGLVYIEIPFLQQYHDDPIDCRRYTQPGLARFMKGFGLEPVANGTHIGPSVTILTLNAYWISMFFEGPSLLHKLVSNGVFLVASTLFWPFKFLDAYLIRKPSAHRLAFGVYCAARKPGAAERSRNI